MQSKMRWLTDAPCEVGVQLISEKRLWKLAEVQLQSSSDGVYVHFSHNKRHVLIVCRKHQT